MHSEGSHHCSLSAVADFDSSQEALHFFSWTVVVVRTPKGLISTAPQLLLLLPKKKPVLEFRFSEVNSPRRLQLSEHQLVHHL